RAARPAAAAREHLFHSIGRAANERFNGAIAAIAHPAREPKLARSAQGEGAKAHPLHAPANEKAPSLGSRGIR
ncbi:MAG TPA: hypothetical protein VKB24_09550, partial [Candidatus Acidoferrum sp.]|nr:hypothetical protein [Candidatus Acidoferrum sp.]